jgi:cyclohexa-1,5-dienecarbonyl-CoA hydratase
VSGEREIRLEHREGGRLARLTVRLSPVNVLSVSDLEMLARRVTEAGTASVLVLTGLARSFSAGVEIADHVPDPDAIERMLSAMRAVVGGLITVPAVTVASVSGACLGGGAEIAAACDLVLVADDARIGFPEIRLACFPPAAAALLPRRVGEARAAYWILTGDTFSGADAARLGFASQSFPAAALACETDRVVASLLAHSPEALAAARDLLRQGRREALMRELPRAEEAYRRLTGSADLARAVREWKKN